MVCNIILLSDLAEGIFIKAISSYNYQNKKPWCQPKRLAKCYNGVLLDGPLHRRHRSGSPDHRKPRFLGGQY